jgi:hypothetical protein
MGMARIVNGGSRRTWRRQSTTKRGSRTGAPSYVVARLVLSGVDLCEDAAESTVRARSGENMNFKTLALVALGASIFVGCASTHYVRIRHPLHVGQVDPNTVPFHAQREENPRGLPTGTLVDRATLTEVTPERVCLQANLWALDEVNPDRGIFQNYNIALLNDQEGVEQSDAQIQLEQPSTAAYNGHIAQQVHAGYRQVCNGYNNGVCTSYRSEPVYRTVYVPHVWQVTNYPATLCFANGGFITPATTRVALEMDGRGPGSMTFEWQFDSAVSTQPAPQQQRASQ